jgi:flavin-binding protein dodecin
LIYSALQRCWPITIVAHRDAYLRELRGKIGDAASTLRNVESTWLNDMKMMIESNNIAGYKANLAMALVLEESKQPA